MNLKKGRYIVSVNNRGISIKDADDYVIIRKDRYERVKRELEIIKRSRAKISSDLA